MKASDIMSRKLYFVTADEPVSKAARLMADAAVGVLPVVDSARQRRLVGMITDRDIVVRHVANQHDLDCPVGTHMTEADLVTVRADDHVHDVMGRMQHYPLRRVPVLDADHRLIGIISQADIAVQVGPQEPLAVEKMIEAVSAPAVAAV